MKTEGSALTRYEDFYAMLSDNIRHEAYQKAIDETVKSGDVVLDLGAGTGILGIMALKAGASKVYMIEKSDSIDLAKEIVIQNGFAEQVTYFNESSLEVELPEKVDVIVSETLGSFGVDENTLEFVIDARKRFLKEGGKIIPEEITVFIEPVESDECNQKLEFWRNIAGIDFAPAHHVFSQKMMVEKLQNKNILAHGDPFCSIDFNTIDDAALMSTTYHVIEKRGTIHGFAGWFDLQLSENVQLSTAADRPTTHWKQAFFPITEKVSVVPNDVVEIQMLVKPKSEASDSTFIKYDYRCTQREK